MEEIGLVGPNNLTIQQSNGHDHGVMIEATGSCITSVSRTIHPSAGEMKMKSISLVGSVDENVSRSSAGLVAGK